MRLKCFKSSYEDGPTTLTGTITQIKYQDGKISLVLKEHKERVQVYYYSHENNFSLGDKVTIDGVLNTPKENTIPHTFNYRLYLEGQGIYKVMNADKVMLVEKNKKLSFKIKKAIASYLDTFKSSKFMKTFIMGDREDFDNYDLYRDLGVAHIFALSGMHISLLARLILKLLQRAKTSFKYGFLIAFLLFYLFLTNYMASIVRSFFMYVYQFLGKLCKYGWDSEQVYYWAIASMLLIRPQYILDKGFQYSAIISFFLIKFRFIMTGSFLRKFFFLSFMAFMSSLPLSININYEINILAILNNLLFVPLIAFVVYPLGLLTFFVPVLDSPYFYLTAMVEKYAAHLFTLKVVVPAFPVFLIVIYYGLWWLFLNTYQKRFFFAIIILLGVHILFPAMDWRAYVYYLDVGQGDATVVKYRDQTIMIDTGGVYNNDLSPDIITFLRSIGAQDIDYLILTHGDFDHLGNARGIAANYPVKEVIFNVGTYNDLERELIAVLDERAIKYTRRPDAIPFARGSLIFLNSPSLANENDDSNVVYLTIDKYRFLFMGDAGIRREAELLKDYNLQNIDFLKVGHHGSDTSTSAEFVAAITPKYAIISVGKNNRYGHPKASVLKTLLHSHIYRTDRDGTIEVTIFHGYKISTFS